MKPTIWIINDSGHPYEKALDAVPNGEFRSLTVGNINPTFTDRLLDQLSEGIGRYGKEEDYLLISGTPTINALAAMLWILRFPTAKILIWDAKLRSYKIRTVERDHAKRMLDRNLM